MTIFINIDDFIASLSLSNEGNLGRLCHDSGYNTRHKSLKQTPLLSNFLLNSHALCPIFKYPNQRWGRGNANKSFKIFDEDCSSACL